MAITTLAIVKLLSHQYTTTGTTAPTTATIGAVGDIFLNTASGLSYQCTAVNAGPPVTYTWVAYTDKDAEIALYITKAEADYLYIRGIPFEVNPESLATVYPSGSDVTAAEMVLYSMRYGAYAGRGKTSETLHGRSVTYSAQGRTAYPDDIIRSIKRYQAYA